ncbi:hypothetical protein QBC41DRAFT_329336 [Cercophora samala]|uniref:Fungal N-terminal domain-containing protein n=1 Tax=Cercophora samala TaxID=330535 RepID=A0AA40D619_9PEZI|nr:hypothetical protein QBC41DRAFT_329336 [Cercophora samala]
MDPFSISIGCITLLEVAQKTIKQLFELSKRYTDARSDLLTAITQLQSLTKVLELIQYDEENQRSMDTPDLKNDLIMDQVNFCMDMIEELQVVIASINDSRIKWAISGKAAVENIYKQLQTATEQLELILEVHVLAITKDIKNDTTELLLGQEQIGAQVQRLSEHMGLTENRGPSRPSIPRSLPSWTSQGVHVESIEQCDPDAGSTIDIHESTIDEPRYTNEAPSRTNSSHWSGSTVYSPPASIPSPTSTMDENARFITPPHHHPVEITPWLEYQHGTAMTLDIPHDVFWSSEVQYSPMTTTHDTAKPCNDITVEHVESPTAPPKEEIIRRQFKQATWSLATTKKKQKSVAETFKEMVRAASLKAASVAA